MPVICSQCLLNVCRSTLYLLTYAINPRKTARMGQPLGLLPLLCQLKPLELPETVLGQLQILKNDLKKFPTNNSIN